MIDRERIKRGLKDIAGSFHVQTHCPYWQETCEDALELIETLEERVAIMTEGKEVAHKPEKGMLYGIVYWFCGNCNEPIEHGNVEQKHLPCYCRLCGAKIDKGENNEDQR